MRTAPFDAEIELAVIDRESTRVGFPVPAGAAGLDQAETGETIAVRPTHWKPSNRPEAATVAPPG